MNNLIYFLVTASIITFTACYSKGQTSNKANWTDCVGTMTRRVYGKSSVGEFEYEFNGRKIRSKSTRGISLYGSVSGEKYIIKVNPQNPEEYIPIDWKPLFTDDEEYDSTVGTVKKISKFRYFCKDTLLATHIVTFTYMVDDEEYERSQALPPLYKEEYINLEKGNNYNVKYSIYNPQRAILIMN